MQFMLALYEDDSVYADGMDGQAWQDIIEAHTAFGEALAKAGVIRGGEGLERAVTATTIRKENGKTAIHDGPYAETKEQLGGFYIIEVDSLNEAMMWAKQVPFAKDGSVEVRPCLGPNG